MLGRAICSIGALAILHAAFSFVHYKEFTRGAGGGGSGGLLELPFDVIVEAGGGFVLCLVGALVGAGKMEPARSTSGLTDTTFDFHMNRADFNLYNHRPVHRVTHIYSFYRSSKFHRYGLDAHSCGVHCGSLTGVRLCARG